MWAWRVVCMRATLVLEGTAGGIMRRFLPILVGCFFLAVPMFGQRGGHGGGGGGHMGGGGGFHGGGGFRGSSGGFRGGGGGFRGGSGFRGNVGYRDGFRSRGFGYRNSFYYPAFYGGYYDPFFWDSSYYSDPYYNSYPYYNGYPAYAYEPAPQPPVIVEQAPEPAVREYPGPTTTSQALQPQPYEEQLYLLAMKDGTIRAVLAYWA